MFILFAGVQKCRLIFAIQQDLIHLRIEVKNFSRTQNLTLQLTVYEEKKTTKRNELVKLCIARNARIMTE